MKDPLNGDNLDARKGQRSSQTEPKALSPEIRVEQTDTKQRNDYNNPSSLRASG